MPIKKHCPNCGNEITYENEFCTECGYDLINKVPNNVLNNSHGFFDNLSEKVNIFVLIFSFIIFGVFLFVGSIFWSLFISKGSIDFITYLLLTVVFSVFFASIFVGYCACKDKSYVFPNFLAYIAGIYAALLSIIGLIFTFLWGLISLLGSIFSSGSSSAYSNPYQSATSSVTPSADLSFIFKIILFILLIPLASYVGIYLGYFLRDI